MVHQKTFLGALLAMGLLSGCQNIDSNTLMQSGGQAFTAATLSNEQVKTLSAESCAQMDQKAQIAPGNNPYDQRLKTIAGVLGDDINGTPAHYNGISHQRG